MISQLYFTLIISRQNVFKYNNDIGINMGTNKNVEFDFIKW